MLEENPFYLVWKCFFFVVTGLAQPKCDIKSSLIDRKCPVRNHFAKFLLNSNIVEPCLHCGVLTRDIRELKQTTTTTATRTSPNKRFNEQNNSCARAL